MNIFRRKNFLIYPKFQVSMILRVVLIAMLNNLAFICSVYYFFYDFKRVGMEIGIRKGHVFYAFLDNQQEMFLKIVLLTSAVTVVLIFISGLMYSHKIVGPLVKMKNYLAKTDGARNASPIQLRKSDYFHDLKDALNSFIDRSR